MNNTIQALVSTSSGPDGVTFQLHDEDHCVLARIAFTFEEWGKVTSMNKKVSVVTGAYAPVLEKHLVRLVPAKGELLGGFAPAVVSVDGMHRHRCTESIEHGTRSPTEEGRFASAWGALNGNPRTHLAYLLTPSTMDQQYPITPSDRDREVAATVIQWLGSPVGQGFLRDLGYVKAIPRPVPVDPLAIPLWVDADVLRLVKARILRAAYCGSPRFAGALPNTPEYTNRIQLVLNGLPSLRAMDDPSIDLTLKAIVLDAIEVEGVNVPREVYEYFRICPLPKDKIKSMMDR